MTDDLKWLRLAPVVVGAVLAISLVVWAFWNSQPAVSANGSNPNWSLIANLCVAAAVSFAVVAILRFALGTLVIPSALQPQSDPTAATRTRLAPVVIGIGTIGIVVVALAVVVAIYQTATDHKVPNSVFLGIFSSVIPIFATWVGAVIAFFFTNESYRTAAAAAGLAKDPGQDFINGDGYMIPYEKITKLVLGQPVPKNASNALAPLEAKAIDMADVRLQLGPTISRLIIFDTQKRPQYIVRKKIDDAAGNKAKTLGEYLTDNQKDATNFQPIMATATVADGRNLLHYFNTVDLFVTEHGSADDPVLGWVPDDKLAP